MKKNENPIDSGFLWCYNQKHLKVNLTEVNEDRIVRIDT